MIALNEQKNCQWRIAKRPNGNVKDDDFLYDETEIPTIENGEILLKTLYLNIAPVMRMYMSGDSVANEKSLDIGDVIHGRGVAEVIESKHPNYKVGEIHQGQIGWQTFKKSKVTPAEKYRKIEDYRLPYSIGLSTLGMTGFSAYFGLLDCGKPNENETVVVSGAAGGVGTNVVQLAKIYGCRVIGIAGSDQKCELIKKLGCDGVINYKKDNVRSSIETLCADGIDIYFDNVGGEILTICLDNLAKKSRVVLCGSISEYLNDKPFGPTNYTKLRKTNSLMQGFFVYNYEDQFHIAEKNLARWVQEKKIRPIEHMFDGFINMPKALASIYEGKNSGVAMCRIRKGPYEN